MFISIPKEFFVPVVFGDGFVLNEENNNLELDTDLYREKTGNKYKVKEEPVKEIIPIEKESEVKVLENKEVPKETILQSKNEQQIEKLDNKKETVDSKPLYVPLKKDKDIHVECKVNTNLFEEVDDEYVDDIKGKGY